VAATGAAALGGLLLLCYLWARSMTKSVSGERRLSTRLLPPAVMLALFGLVLLLRFLGRGGTYGGPSADPGRQAQAHYFTVRRALGRAGLASPTSTTPNEFLTQAAPRLAARKKVSGALQQATTLYEEAAYSPHPPAARAVDSARHAWVGSFWEWLRLVFSKKEKN
jgi:hypothetical protein